VSDTFTALPILSLASARDPAHKADFLTKLREALLHTGFLYLNETGISDELLERVAKQTHVFFDEDVLPLAEKEKIEMKHEKSFLGWSRVSVYPFSFFFHLNAFTETLLFPKPSVFLDNDGLQKGMLSFASVDAPDG
jgi:hypothetical protein